MRWLSSTAQAPRRLKLGLLLFFLALAIPTLVLVTHAYQQLKWEAFHQHRLMAEELSQRIDAHLQGLIHTEDARSYGEFSFITIEGNSTANYAQRSELSRYPVRSDIPGLIGWFQVDAQGRFSTPLLPGSGDPAEYGLDGAELEARQALAGRLRGVLSEHRLVVRDSRSLPPTVPEALIRQEQRESSDADLASRTRESADRSPDQGAAAEPEGQALFDQLAETGARPAARKQENLARVEDLKLGELAVSGARQASREPAAAAPPPDRRKRVEQAMVAESAGDTQMQGDDASAAGEALRVRTFESEIDPFEMALLDSGHLVLFRKVWRDDQRMVQGALIDTGAFVGGLISASFQGTLLSQAADLVVAWRGDILELIDGQNKRARLAYDSAFSAEDLGGTLLYQTPMSPPLSALSLTFSLNRLPVGPGARVVHWMAAIMALVLAGGFFALYRLGLRQIALLRQQQDFVSAVSHELKTPLTSIRMYSEMLKAGWVDEDKKRGYYDFIFAESERLSRLIANVLQLARMSRGNGALKLESRTVAELQDIIRSRIAAHADRAGFKLDMRCPDSVGQSRVKVDEDAFVQIFINLVDNAVKFAAASSRNRIDFVCRRDGSRIAFAVRDYGPGIPPHQIRKIFRLFYRAENELTRETVGTGIGLALVRQLAAAMDGRVDVRNRDPGAEFTLRLPEQADAGDAPSLDKSKAINHR